MSMSKIFLFQILNAFNKIDGKTGIIAIDTNSVFFYTYEGGQISDPKEVKMDMEVPPNHGMIL